MAVFESQISALVTNRAKDWIKSVLKEDLEVNLATTEADVIRAVLELGLPLLARVEAETRCESYALMRRGLAPEGLGVASR